MNLIIDIGNTIAKFVFFDGDKPVEEHFTSKDTLDILPDILLGKKCDRGILSSVISLSREAEDKLSALPFPLLMFSSQTPIPIHNGYRSPQTLGTDRLAAVIGAATTAPGQDILVIDAGTCITYDFIDSKGLYHGGNISPGIHMRLNALHQLTDRLPLTSEQGECPDMGYDTETAIRSGVLTGIRHEMAGYIRSLTEQHPSLQVFLTGGDHITLEQKKNIRIFADHFLVARGLNRILDYNEK